MSDDETSLTQFRPQMRSGDMLLLESSLKQHNFMFKKLFCLKLHFSKNLPVTYQRTDGRSDERTHLFVKMRERI